MLYGNCLITSLLGNKILLNLPQKTSGNFQVAMKRISEVKKQVSNSGSFVVSFQK